MSDTDEVQLGMVKVMNKAGLDPAMIYAFKKTGLLVGEDSSEEHKEEWCEAMDEYYEMRKKRRRKLKRRS